jgi:hypothetical protein
MTLGQEILRAFLLTLGAAEIITNTTYLMKENGLDLAKKQHGELPTNIGYEKIKIKVICMLLSGIVLFGVSLSTYIFHRYNKNIVVDALIAYSLYGITEALYYRYWKTFGFASVTILLLICSIFI